MYEVEGGNKIADRRSLAAWVHVGKADPILVVSLYIFCVEGLSDANLSILSKVGSLVSASLSSCIIGGDFNVEPSVLGDCEFVETLGVQVVVPSQPTCLSTGGKKYYDYVIVSSGLSKCVSFTGVDAALPSRLTILSLCTSFRSCKICRF